LILPEDFNFRTALKCILIETGTRAALRCVVAVTIFVAIVHTIAPFITLELVNCAASTITGVNLATSFQIIAEDVIQLTALSLIAIE